MFCESLIFRLPVAPEHGRTVYGPLLQMGASTLPRFYIPQPDRPIRLTGDDEPSVGEKVRA